MQVSMRLRQGFTQAYDLSQSRWWLKLGGDLVRSRHLDELGLTLLLAKSALVGVELQRLRTVGLLDFRDLGSAALAMVASIPPGEG